MTTQIEKPPRKDRIIVVLTWIALVWIIREALFFGIPNHILGGVGALGIATITVLAVFKYVPIDQNHKERFKRVLRYWYSRKNRWQWLWVAFGAFNIYNIILIEHGHAIADPMLKQWSAELNNVTNTKHVEREINAYMNNTSTFDKIAILEVTEYGGLADKMAVFNWSSVYQEAEYWIFFGIVRYWRIFG